MDATTTPRWQIDDRWRHTVVEFGANESACLLVRPGSAGKFMKIAMPFHKNIERSRIAIIWRAIRKEMREQIRRAEEYDKAYAKLEFERRKLFVEQCAASDDLVKTLGIKRAWAWVLATSNITVASLSTITVSELRQKCGLSALKAFEIALFISKEAGVKMRGLESTGRACSRKPERKTETITVKYWACGITRHRHRLKKVAAQCIHRELRRGP